MYLTADRSAPNGHANHRGRFLLLAQTALSIALLAYVFSNVDLKDAAAAARGANPLLLMVAVLQLSAQIFLAAARWEIVARSLGGELPFRIALRFTWIGVFFNQALPASVGGDGVRIWLYWLRFRNRRIAVHSVALERLVMIGSLLLLVLAVQPGLATRGAPVSIVFTDAFVLGVMAICLLLLLAARPMFQNPQRFLVIRLLGFVAEDIRVLLRNVPRSAMVTLLSLAAHVNISITAWLIAQALGLALPLMDCLILIPVVVLASTLPISVGGWGIREGVTVSLLALVGVSSAEALALSLLLGFAGIAISLPGAILWLNQRTTRPRGESILHEYAAPEQQQDPFSREASEVLPRQG
ncbi:MAG: conserved rane protein of unknown function [Betaproteobacteria bacterium]|nr:conserved rane protein of unknown function [Betaproteobacteria bacterium]